MVTPYNAAAQEAWTQIGIQASSEQAKEIWSRLKLMIFSKFPHKLKFHTITDNEATPMVRRFLEHEGVNFFNHTDARFMYGVRYWPHINDEELKMFYSGLYYFIKRAVSIAVQEHTRPDRRAARPTSSPNPGVYSAYNVYPSPTENADYDYDSLQVHFGVLSEDLQTFFAWMNKNFTKLNRNFIDGLFKFAEECYAMEESSLTILKMTVFNADGHRRGPPPRIFILRSDLSSHFQLERFALTVADDWKNGEGVLQLAVIPSRREILVTNTSGPVATKRTFQEMEEGGYQ